MKILKKVSVMILTVLMVCSFNVIETPALQKTTGYHPLNKKIESPDETQGTTFYARSLSRYYSSLELGNVTSVKDQGNTELCWAFGLTSLGETSLIKQGLAKKNVDFSEKHLGYFMYNRQNDILNNTNGDKTKVYGNWKYAGGNAQLAMLALTGWYGLASESIAPFNSSQWKLSDKIGQKDTAILKNGYFIGDNPSINVIKEYIRKYGAVVMAYHAPETTNEETKYYDKSRKSYNCTSSKTIANHIVTIVGWNDNYSRNLFGKSSTPKKNGAWIIKNSWGNKEGDKGYTYVSYEDRSMCEFLSGQFVKASEYNYNYFYDGSANPGSIRVTKGNQIANIYTAKKGTKNRQEVLKAVNLVTWGKNIKYSIQIYKNPRRGNPASGQRMLKYAQKGTLREAGTHTIDLKQKVKLIKGEKFSVVIKMDSTGSVGYDRTEDYGWISFVNKTAREQSYIYTRGRWRDLYDARMTMRIKAYTTQ